MPPGIELTGFTELRAIDVPIETAPRIARCSVGAHGGEQIRDRLRISGCAKERLNSCMPKVGEEVAQVHPQNDPAAGVGRDEGFDRIRLTKPVRNGMKGNLFQDAGQNPSLELFEPRLGRFDQSNISGLLR